MMNVRPKADLKANESIQYECEVCDICFCLIDHGIQCPSCGSTDLNKMVIVYKEYDSEMAELVNEADLSAGD